MSEMNDAPERLSDTDLGVIAEAADRGRDGKWFKDPGDTCGPLGRFLFLATPTAVLSMARELQLLRAIPDGALICRTDQMPAEAVEALLAELARFREATTPRPIDTVPVEQNVLVWADDGAGWDCHWFLDQSVHPTRTKYTHWLPLPEYPKP